MNVSAPAAAPDPTGLALWFAAPPDLSADLPLFAPFAPSRPAADAETPHNFLSVFGGLLPLDAGTPPDQRQETPEPDETKAAPLLLLPVSVLPRPVAPPAPWPRAIASTEAAPRGTEAGQPALPVATAPPPLIEEAAAGVPPDVALSLLSQPVLPGLTVAAPFRLAAERELPQLSPRPVEAMAPAPAPDRPPPGNQALAFAARLVASGAAEAAAPTPRPLGAASQEPARATAPLAVLPVSPAAEGARDAQPPAAAKPPAPWSLASPAPSEASLDLPPGMADDRVATDRDCGPAPAPPAAEAHAEAFAAHPEPRRERADAPAVGDRMPHPEVAVSQNTAAPAPSILKNSEPVETAHGREAAAPRPVETETPTPSVRPAAPAASPARDISLRVSADGRERVELRVSDRAGEVRVAVRTADPDLAGALRENLPELVHRLERSGFETETWRPVQSASASLDPRQAPRGAAGDSFAGSHGHPQQDQQRDRRQQQPDRSRWVEEIENNFAPASERTPWLHP